MDLKNICIILSSFCACGYALTQTEIDSFTGGGGVTEKRNKLVLTGNGIPVVNTSETVDSQVKSYTFKVPKNPKITTIATCLRGGPVAITIEGVVMFGPLTSASYNAVEAEQIGFDECNGHNSPTKTYHYHYMPKCVYTGEVDQFIGVAFDGFPIYGPISSWIDSSRNATAEDLDECHGKVNPSDSTDYRYIATYDFPYLLGCNRGTPIDNFVTAYPGFGNTCVDSVTDPDTQEEKKSWAGSYGTLCRCDVTYPDDFDESKRELHTVNKDQRKMDELSNVKLENNGRSLSDDQQKTYTEKRGHVARKFARIEHHARNNGASKQMEKKSRERKTKKQVPSSKIDEVYRLLKKWLKMNE